MPVNGIKLKEFGAPDAVGGTGKRHFGRHPRRRPGNRTMPTAGSSMRRPSDPTDNS